MSTQKYEINSYEDEKNSRFYDTDSSVNPLISHSIPIKQKDGE